MGRVPEDFIFGPPLTSVKSADRVVGRVMMLRHTVVCSLALARMAMAQDQPRLVADVPETPSTVETVASRTTISADLLRQSLSSKAKEILLKALHAAEGGDHPAAIRLMLSVLAKYPESDAWTQSMLGVEYLKTGQNASAVTALERALELLPRDAIDHANLGLALALMGQYDRAEPELRRAVALDGTDAKTRRLLELVIAAKTPSASRNSAASTAALTH